MHSEEVGAANTEHFLHFCSDVAVKGDKVAVTWHCVNDARSGKSLMPGRHSIREAKLRAILLVLQTIASLGTN